MPESAVAASSTAPLIMFFADVVNVRPSLFVLLNAQPGM
jgi:hypothetical protein